MKQYLLSLKSCFLMALLASATMTLSSPGVTAQETAYPNYTFTPSERIRDLVREALSDKIDEFQSLPAHENLSPMIQYATQDLNGDGNPEIIARFAEEYAFRDEANNTETYVFAYTSRGMIKIFEAMAGDIAFGRLDESGLRQIIAFKGLTPQYDVYSWDGSRRYVKK